MNLQEKSQKLLELKNQIEKIESDASSVVMPLKLEKDLLQKDIQDEMKSTGQLSTRYEFGTFTISSRKSLQISNIEELVPWLKENEPDCVSELPNDKYQSLAKSIVKTGELIPGTEIRETEFMSIRQPKENE